MDSLYKKVIGGKFTKIPKHYSNDLWELLRCMI